jgi:hypothetical protein
MAYFSKLYATPTSGLAKSDTDCNETCPDLSGLSRIIPTICREATSALCIRLLRGDVVYQKK